MTDIVLISFLYFVADLMWTLYLEACVERLDLDTSEELTLKVRGKSRGCKEYGKARTRDQGNGP